MIKTLRVRLLCYTSAATAIVLLAAGVVVFFLTRASLISEFDRALLSAARVLQSATEQTADGVRVDPDRAQFPEYSRSDSADYFQVWLDDGTEAARSTSLSGKSSLTRPKGTSHEPAYCLVTLPDGRPGRELGLRFVPAAEDEDKQRPSRPAREVTLLIGRHTSQLDSRLAALKWLLMLVGITATAVTAATLYVAVARGLRPLRTLSTRIAQIGQANLLQRIELPDTPAELVGVVDRLNELLGRLHETIMRERGFTADVAHELRTPLAGLAVTLEVSALKQRTPADYETRINKSLDIVRDMRSMVDNLLALAHSDAGHLDTNPRDIDLRPFIEECWSHFARRAADRGLRSSCQFEPARLRSDADQLRIVLHNLMDNAVSYATPGGDIAIAVRQHDAVVEIMLRNSATIDPAQVPHVFGRFWRADAARADTGIHSGLGLSLCKKIVQLLGGSITAEPYDPRMFQIVLRLPAVIAPLRSALENGVKQPVLEREMRNRQ